MIKVKDLKKNFYEGQVETKVLKGIDIHIEKGEFVAIMGRSGAGKSTFLYQVSLLDVPTSGEIIIDGVDTHNFTEEQKIDFRLHELGYVFQDYALLPDLTSVENVALPLLMQGESKKDAYKKAEKTLGKMGLEKRMNALPANLSGGEQQRVSISRAIVHKPKILFADEPTANLDNESSKIVMKILEELHEQGQTIVMVTHEEEYGSRAQRIIRLDDGQIVKIEKK
jgi:putative ABC transport system ATP-binding protein